MNSSCRISTITPGGQSGGLTEADMGKMDAGVWDVSIRQEAFTAALRIEDGAVR